MVITLTGENGFKLSTELDRLVGAFVKEYGDFAVEKLDAEDVDFQRVRESLENLPFLSRKKMVILRAPGTQKQFVDECEKLIEHIPDSIELIILEPKLDKRSTYAKFLQKKTDYKLLNEPDEQEFAELLVAYAKGLGGSISRPDALYLIQRTASGQQMLFNELEKLLLYQPHVTRDAINLLINETPQSTIFQLIDSAFSGQAKKALDIYEQQRQLKVEPQRIIAMLTWQLQILALIKTAGNRSIDEISKQSRQSQFVIRKNQSITKNLSLAQLCSAIRELVALDMRSKTALFELDEGLRTFITSLAIQRAEFIS